MRDLRRVSAAVSMLAALTACGPSEQQSKAARSQAESVASEPMSHDLGPFFQAEMEMKERMIEAEGIDAADSWLRKTIEHNRGAIEMSKALLQQLPSGRVAALARATVDRETREIAALRRLLREGAPDHLSAMPYHPALVRMHDAMMEAQGANPSEIWLRKMQAHHKGSIEIATILLRQKNVPPVIRTKAETTRREQRREIQILEHLLREKRE